MPIATPACQTGACRPSTVIAIIDTNPSRPRIVSVMRAQLWPLRSTMANAMYGAAATSMPKPDRIAQICTASSGASLTVGSALSRRSAVIDSMLLSSSTGITAMDSTAATIHTHIAVVTVAGRGGLISCGSTGGSGAMAKLAWPTWLTWYGPAGSGVAG